MLSTLTLCDNTFFVYLLFPCYFTGLICPAAAFVGLCFAIYLAMNAKPPRPSSSRPCPNCAAPIDLRLNNRPDTCPHCHHNLTHPSPQSPSLTLQVPKSLDAE